MKKPHQTLDPTITPSPTKKAMRGNILRLILSTHLTATVGLSLILLGITPALTQNQPHSAPPVLPKTPPNLTFNVERQSGNCPKTVKLWAAWRYYEGGGEHTVIADTVPIAGTARIVSSNKKLVEYKAPLKKTYNSCVGQAKSPSQDYPYRFQFRDGNVYFRVELPPDTPSTPSEITAQSVVVSRPYVRWAVAD